MIRGTGGYLVLKEKKVLDQLVRSIADAGLPWRQKNVGERELVFKLLRENQKPQDTVTKLCKKKLYVYALLSPSLNENIFILP